MQSLAFIYISPSTSAIDPVVYFMVDVQFRNLNKVQTATLAEAVRLSATIGHISEEQGKDGPICGTTAM